MGHYVCHPIIRSLGPSGAHKGPNFIFKMMRLNVWHMHCWHNSWVSLYYLIPKHVCCGSDGEGQIAKLWTSARKIQENNHACAHTQIHREPWNITQDHTQKCTWTVSAHLTPPPSQYHYSSVLDKKTHTYTPTRQPIGSPFQAAQSAPTLQ